MEEQNRYPEINPDRLPRAQEVFADAGGSFVEVITIAADIKTGEKIVVYREMSLPFRVLAGPLPDFQEKYQGIFDESRGRTPEAEKEINEIMQNMGYTGEKRKGFIFCWAGEDFVEPYARRGVIEYSK